MQMCTSCEANSCLASQERPRNITNVKGYYFVQKSPALGYLEAAINTLHKVKIFRLRLG
jgi:hypothetical protein